MQIPCRAALELHAGSVSDHDGALTVDAADSHHHSACVLRSGPIGCTGSDRQSSPEHPLGPLKANIDWVSR